MLYQLEEYHQIADWLAESLGRQNGNDLGMYGPVYNMPSTTSLQSSLLQLFRELRVCRMNRIRVFERERKSVSRSTLSDLCTVQYIHSRPVQYVRRHSKHSAEQEEQSRRAERDTAAQSQTPCFK